jgi:hypothetical protein
MLIAKRTDGSLVTEGETVKDFRGQHWTFIRASRASDFGSSGRVEVKDEYERKREFFPTVFDLSVEELAEPEPEYRAAYEVSVSNSFETDTPEDAVRQMIEWLQENVAHTGFRVFDNEGSFVGFYDGDKL